MSAVVRHNPALDIFMNPDQETPPVNTNGHAPTNRISDLVTTPAKGDGIADILDRLAELDPAAIDAELAALNRRVAILQNLKALVGAGVTPGPKDESPAPGTKFEAARERILIHLARNGPTRAGQLAKACQLEAKALTKIIGNSPFITKGRNRLDPYRLTPEGVAAAKKLRT